MRSGHRGCIKYAITLLVAGTLLLMLGCPLGGLAIQYGYVAPPTIHSSLGAIGLHAVTALDPECPMAGCGAQYLNSSLQHYYVVWVEIISNNAGNVQVTGHRLLVMRLRR
jgi:hypothetical protein